MNKFFHKDPQSTLNNSHWKNRKSWTFNLKIVYWTKTNRQTKTIRMDWSKSSKTSLNNIWVTQWIKWTVTNIQTGQRGIRNLWEKIFMEIESMDMKTNLMKSSQEVERKATYFHTLEISFSWCPQIMLWFDSYKISCKWMEFPKTSGTGQLMSKN